MKKGTRQGTAGRQPGLHLLMELLLIGVVCFTGFLVRIYVGQFHGFVTWDGAYYINYFRDSVWQSVFHPGYPLFIELFRLIIPDGVRAAQMVSIVAGALLPLPVFFLARQYMGPVKSIFAALVVVLNPLIVKFGTLTMTESLFILFQVLVFIFYLKRKPILFGILNGISYLTRPEALLAYGIISAFDIFKSRDWKFFRMSAVFLLVFIIPYVVYLKVQTGEWTLSAKTMNLRVWEKDWRINVAHESSDTPVFSLRERAASGLANYPERLYEYFRLLYKFAGIPLIVLGTIGLIKHRNILLAGLPMLFILPLFGLDPGERFLIPFIPILVLYAFLFITDIRRNILQIGSVIVLLLGYIPTLSYAITPEQGIAEFCVAGKEMKSKARQGDIFVDRKPYTAFYAGGRYVPMPNDPVDSILSFCKKIDAQYLVVSARVVRVFRPQLNFLLYSDTVINRLHLKTAYVAGLDSGYGVRILEIPK